ncbi:hypothetical protein F5Y16DRAFT_414385 [Xylariaceae sp. FL0255]|nr:hypothetical protein F5Y16DRAFT_414385 [Xylariaceae sp. FL0255]
MDFPKASDHLPKPELMKQGIKRKRIVASCLPCYSKKQKCNRQFPCDHCVRRRQPELCSFYSSRPVSPPSQSGLDAGETSVVTEHALSATNVVTKLGTTEDPITGDHRQSLSEAFGYFVESESNVLPIIRQHGYEDAGPRLAPTSVSADIEVLRDGLSKLPDRSIIDFLIQYFFREVNWIYQLIHPPSFMRDYERWRTRHEHPHLEDVDFSILVPRICIYTSLFLPSREYTSDVIRGLSLSDIRGQCNNAACRLDKLSSVATRNTAVTRIQSLCLLALSHSEEGHQRRFRSVFSQIIHEIKEAGMHREPLTSKPSGLNEIEQEVRRRVFCNVYIWDRRLANFLDHDALLAETSLMTGLPRMQLGVEMKSTGTRSPDSFLGRRLEAQLAKFRLCRGQEISTAYDPISSEEWFEKFCTEFLPQIPDTYALLADGHWDKQVGDLPRQRELFHVALYESVCCNFRGLLKMDPKRMQSLPSYKRSLVLQHCHLLQEAAMGLLEKVSLFHQRLGFQQTRFQLLLLHYFEGSLYLGLSIRMMDRIRDSFEKAVDNQLLCRATVPPDSRRQLLWPRLNTSDSHCQEIMHVTLGSLDKMAACCEAAETAASVLRRMGLSGHSQKDIDNSWYNEEHHISNESASLSVKSFQDYLSFVGTPQSGVGDGRSAERVLQDVVTDQSRLLDTEISLEAGLLGNSDVSGQWGLFAGTM